ncbi:IclR family transcriptional regulator [Sinobaca sp. H24]|uniref:IclR family transcriptional regulator n=1 Tax=Sinobaca sp. H24 TaxID=2923376 RepID=UPI00207A0446|nr:IclR family transcriptional regulator [Sinobaca sp. H24]
MVKSVDRALQMIAVISTHKEGIGVTGLAEKIGVTKSAAFKILTTLVEHGYAEQDRTTKKYKLGYKYLELSSLLLESMDIRTLARPFLQELEEETNEVIHLVVMDQEQMVYIDKLEGYETLRMHSKVGRRAPGHCTSAGKMILAHLSPEEVEHVLREQGMEPHTPYTITDKGVLLKELEAVRNRGYAVEEQENELGITCIAAPVFDNKKKITGAVSISGPSIRMSKERIQKISPLLIDVTSRISSRLGYIKAI